MINSIKHLYPAAVPLVDFILQDNSDGTGPFIAKWDESKLGPKPTKAELDAVSIVADKARLDAETSDKAKAELAAIDLTSIRSIREYIAAKPDAPAFLKAQEALAVTARSKIKQGAVK